MYSTWVDEIDRHGNVCCSCRLMFSNFKTKALFIKVFSEYFCKLIVCFMCAFVCCCSPFIQSHVNQTYFRPNISNQTVHSAGYLRKRCFKYPPLTPFSSVNKSVPVSHKFPV